VLKILRPYLFSMIWGISLAAFTVISILFVFFVGYEFVLWLVSPSNLQSSLQLGDQIFKFLIP
jgi:CBS domain containing-hemolysin-like protein